MTRDMHPQRWGDPAAAHPLPESARGLVELAFGLQDSPAVEAVDLPPPALTTAHVDALAAIVGPGHVTTGDAARRLRTRGKSTPDLLRARAGDLSDAPDVVVRPSSHDEVQAVLELSSRERIAVVPFGGGTAVTGGLVARRDGFAGVVSLDLGRMTRLVEVDTESMTATLEPGLSGPEVEAALGEHGLTHGHFPQSLRVRVRRRFAATRSSGQSSAGTAASDAMVVGLRVATPTGSVEPRRGSGQRGRSRPAPGVPGSGGPSASSPPSRRARAGRPRSAGVRGLAVAVVRRRRGRDARARPGGSDADGAAPVGRDRDRDQPGRS